MAIQQQGFSGVVAEVDAGRRAQRFSLNPDSGTEVVGHYIVGEPSGLVATAGALGEVFQFRNSHASNLVVVEKLHVAMTVGTAITVAQELGWDVIRSTAWSGQGTLGTALTPLKRRSSLNASTMTAGDIRVAATAVLGAGTKTFDGFRVASGPGPSSNAVGQSGPMVPMPEDDLRYPFMVLAPNEGFSVRNLVALASGAARFHIRMMWREVTSY